MMLTDQDSNLAMNAICYAADAWKNAAYAAEQAALEQRRPFTILKPRMFPDGDKWCALYGENLQEGIAGFGDTPEKAAMQFDIEFLNQRLPKRT